MEPHARYIGDVLSIERLQDPVHMNLISDGDSKSHGMILEEQPYGSDPD